MQKNKYQIGKQIYTWGKDLFPICRSITGNGVRETLSYLNNLMPDLKIYEVPSGTKAFDWTVPREWNIKEAYILSPDGRKIVDFQNNNLHVVSYSLPVDKEITLKELQGHLHSLPDQPDAIPYITSYYKEEWGFCISHNQRELLKKGKYKVFIDSSLTNGSLTYGELLIKGTSKEEIFLSTYICHPSMANNEISGPVVTTYLAKWIKSLKNRKYSYRIIFIPETIGSIVYLSKNWVKMKQNIIAGFVVTCVGDDNGYSYVKSRKGDTLADRVVDHVMKHVVGEYKAFSFLERGSDERQYCSPGIDLPVCAVCRTKFREYKEYHTSLDNLDFISPEGLEGSYTLLRQCINLLEANNKYKVNNLCEPQLGKRGLYPKAAHGKSVFKQVKNIMNFIAYADGEKDLIEIADTIGIFAEELFEMVRILEKKDIISKL